MFKSVVFGAAALFIPAMAGATPAPPAADYVMKAGQSDQFEIEAGRLAEENGGSRAVKRFGAKMVTDHTKSTQLVLDAAKKSRLSIPDSTPQLDSDQQAMLSDLQGRHGRDFDSVYIIDQTKAHEMALDLQRSYAESGDDPHLRAAARKIVPVVNMHIAMLKKMGD